MDALEELLGEQARGCWSLPHHITSYVSTTRSSNDGDGVIDKSTTSIPSTSSSSPPPPPPSDVSADSTTPPPEGALLPTDKRSANSIRVGCPLQLLEVCRVNLDSPSIFIVSSNNDSHKVDRRVAFVDTNPGNPDSIPGKENRNKIDLPETETGIMSLICKFEMGRACSTYGYRVLVGRSEVKRPLERRRRRWEDKIKMDLREVGYDVGDWINLA
ncbi:hypothetical protein ANN_08398 [Periplaneta americana]|uniref:Uncharacterized protein n=1 Tax=Periplaneta americana TaxID=6978 RepID=A0ABQ8T1C2_PERAM|nr:hypothetical protein ANN_08398 [Periplaneta americana]